MGNLFLGVKPLMVFLWTVIIPDKILTLQQLQDVQQNEFFLAVCWSLTALLISFIVSNLIAFQGGDDKSYVKRRVWHIIIGVLSVIDFYYFYYLYVIPRIANPGFRSMLYKTNLQCLGVTAGIYIVVGLIIMLCFRRSKFGSILGKVKD